MNTKIRYDLDSLELANGDFGYPITEKEVQKVNRMLERKHSINSPFHSKNVILLL